MNDYFDAILGYHEARAVRFPIILEAYRGTAVVEWWGRIERQLVDMVNRFETTRDLESKAKAETMLGIWRKNQITGSVNIETVNTLLSASEVLSVDKWNQSNYFAALRDSLRKLVAGQEELPPLEQVDKPRGGPGGGGGGAPNQPIEPGPEPEPPEGSEGGPAAQDFGPEPTPGGEVDAEGKPVEEPESEDERAEERPL